MDSCRENYGKKLVKILAFITFSGPYICLSKQQMWLIIMLNPFPRSLAFFCPSKLTICDVNQSASMRWLLP